MFVGCPCHAFFIDLSMDRSELAWMHLSAETILLGTIGGFASGAATCLGTLLFLIPAWRGKRIDHLISIEFALGMMLAASVFSLLLPSLSETWTSSDLEHFIGALISILLGVLFISHLGKILSDFTSFKGDSQRPVLFIVAMMLHNLPEGVAPGAALAGMKLEQSLPIIGAIALQNLPEGFTTALAFRALGASTGMAALGSFASGGVELLGGVIGGSLVGMVDGVLPYLLGFAGGAMITVSIRETWEQLSIPENRKRAFIQLLAGAFLILLFSALT